MGGGPLLFSGFSGFRRVWAGSGRWFQRASLLIMYCRHYGFRRVSTGLGGCRRVPAGSSGLRCLLCIADIAGFGGFGRVCRAPSGFCGGWWSRGWFRGGSDVVFRCGSGWGSGASGVVPGWGRGWFRRGSGWALVVPGWFRGGSRVVPGRLLVVPMWFRCGSGVVPGGRWWFRGGSRVVPVRVGVGGSGVVPKGFQGDSR